MPTHRVLAAALALLISAAAPAHAQRWGGGGPGVSPSERTHTHAHVTYRGPILAQEHGLLDNEAGARRQIGGGSWDGRRPTAGGSPPAQPAQTGQNLDGFFGYVPPRGQVINQTPQTVEPVLRTRDAYAARRARP
jgi:hypothetical protein